jgi:hypothetical protein
MYQVEVFIRSRRAILGSFLFSVLFAIMQFSAFATGSVTLAWNASTDPIVAGYNVYYGGASGAYTNEISVGNATNATISGLVQGTTYYFAATTYAASGMESPFSSEVSYLVPMNAPIVNQPPTLNTISNLIINKNASLQTVNLSGITSGATNENQTLTVTAVSISTGLISKPTVNYTSANSTGSLTFTPATNGSGTATITVTVNDGGTSNNIVTRTFTVTVNAVNQTPTILEQSNTYTAVVCTNLFRFRTNTLPSGRKIVMPLPPAYTNFVFTGFWIYYSPLGVWTLQSSSNLLTWFNYATVTNAVFIPHTGGNRYFRLKAP